MTKPRHEKKHFKKKFKRRNDDDPDKKPQNNVKPVRISKPQKSSKHKKMKSVDPFYVGPRGGDKKLQGVNLKPKNAEQESSRAERIFQEMKDKAKTMSKKKLKGTINPFEEMPIEDLRGIENKSKTPKYVQGKRESDKNFFKRMDQATSSEIAKAQFESKYNVRLDKQSKAKERTNSVIKNTKRLQEKKHRKKERKKELAEDKKSGFEKYKDEVKFGEVAMEPPRLAAVPRKAPSETAKAGGRSLLLTEIMRENSASGRNVANTTRKLGQTTKRKLLSPAQRVMRDAERNTAINLYREMKAKKMAMHSQS